MNRVLLTKLHLAFAAFMFPAVLMFLVTGGLYTWGNKGEWREQSAQIAAPMEGATEESLRQVAADYLTEQDIALPSGSSNISGEGEDLSFSWTGARSDISISATADPAVADVTVKEATIHRWLVQLHKAKGSTVFKVYATLLALCLFLLVASGLVMGFQVRALRKLTIGTSAIGLAAFIGAVLLG